MRVDVRFHESPSTTELLTRIAEGVENMALDLTRIRREVSESTTVQKGVAVLVRKIGAQLRAQAEELAGQPAVQAELDGMADQLDAGATDLGAAAAENTAAEDEVPPVEPPVG